MLVYHGANSKHNIPEQILLSEVKYGFIVDSIVFYLVHIKKKSKKKLKNSVFSSINRHLLPEIFFYYQRSF